MAEQRSAAVQAGVMKFKREPLERAIAAHYKEPGALYHTEDNCEEVTLDGLTYCVIRNSSEVLSVYRVQNNGSLRKLTRYPKELDNF